jgi:hypothetical protein
MEEEKYGLTLATQPISLLRVPHLQDGLTIAYPIFSPNCQGLMSNIDSMKRFYLHPVTLERITFREPTTTESISAVSYKFKEIFKREVFDNWQLPNKILYAGRMSHTSEGVFVNPPKDADGNLMINEAALKSFLKGVEPIKVGRGKVYIIQSFHNLGRFIRDFGFAEYDSFTSGPQDSEDFATGGLARVLEHTEKTAEKLLRITSRENFPEGVNVSIFGSSDSFATFSSLGEYNRPRTQFFMGADPKYEQHIGVIFGVLDDELKIPQVLKI